MDPGLPFHGRRQGRKIRPGRAGLMAEYLPRLAFSLEAGKKIAPASLFPAQFWDFALEIGFGGGEHLAEQARHHPEIGHIGCEVFRNGIAALVAAIAKEGIGNIRLYPEDARQLLPHLEDHAFVRIYLLFPDPWPKRRHRDRRFLNPATLGHFARLLKPGGELRLASDDPSQVTWMLAHMMPANTFRWLAERSEDWLHRPADWPETRYERKSIEAGRRPHFFRFRRG